LGLFIGFNSLNDTMRKFKFLKGQQTMKLKSNFFYLPFLLLSACSDVPSSSDLEQQIGEFFSECKSISVDVKKTNGRALENGNYLVKAEIELELEPLQENTELWEKFLTDSDDYEKKVVLLGDKVTTSSPTYEEDLRAYMTAKEEFTYTHQGFNMFNLDGRDVFQKEGSNFDKNCKVSRNKLAMTLKMQLLELGSSYTKSAEILAKGTKNTFTTEIEMMKTENGWQFK
jgi:hypothetical protein